VSGFALLLDRVLLGFELLRQRVTGNRIVLIRLADLRYLGFDRVLLGVQFGAQGGVVESRRG
jgi:hypothetical protein